MNGLIRKISIFTLAGAVICILAVTLSSFGNGNDLLAVSSESEQNAVNDGDSEASVDPFGYFNGKWNLWEYIGDSVSSMIQ